jgi:hypothetical protein
MARKVGQIIRRGTRTWLVAAAEANQRQGPPGSLKYYPF